VESLSIFRMSRLPAQTQSHPAEPESPPIENFLATVLCRNTTDRNVRKSGSKKL